MRVLLVVAVVMLLAPDGDAKSLRRQCRKQCRDEISACVTAGGKRRRCRRQILRRCRQEGLTTCLPAGSPATSTTTTTQAGGTSTTTTTTTPAGGTTTTTTPPMVNGCDPATSVDRRGESQVTVQFDFYFYSPPCFIVSPGTVVTFTGSFLAHPLRGGQVVGGDQVPDPSSPFEPGTSTGTSKSFTLPQGTFPFYCDAHGASRGMVGAAYVLP